MNVTFATEERLRIKFFLASGLLILAISNLSAATLFVSQGNLNPAAPYATWSTAATNIQDAINSSAPNDVVLVTNGVYSGGLSLSKPLTLLSANGPLFTTINGGGTNRCIIVTSPVSVSGFTMTNGWTSTDGGAVWSSYQGAFLTNCIFSGNCASNGGAVFEGTLYSCLLTSNCASNGAGGGAWVSVLYNCTLTGNSAARGGGAFYSFLHNCIIYYNTATNGSNYASIWGMTNCCTTPNPGMGVGNITSPPLFVDYAGGNLRLQSTSPCIDAGNNAFVFEQTDLDGSARISGNAVDMGAYEFQEASPPIVVVQPVGQTVYAGSSVTLDAVANGSMPLSWQWQLNGSPVSGATNSRLQLGLVTTNLAGNYSVVITNTLGAVTSQLAVLTVIDTKPSITAQPSSQSVVAGTNVTFTAGAVGSLPLSWQWQFNGVPVPAATAPSLTLTSVTSSQAGGYSVVVTNSLGSVTSQVAVLTILPGVPPSITTQPSNQIATAGSSVIFTASATGFLPLYWQWLFNGNPLRDATNSSLTLTAVTPGQAGTYSVLVANAGGSATSTNATLIVRVPGTKYVWQNSANPTPPYSSWATAAHVIQDAVDAAIPGDEIVVTNGVYTTGGRTAANGPATNRVAIDKAVTVQSVNGPLVTTIQGYQIPGTIDGKEAIRCVYLSDGAVLSGFTLTGGATGAYNTDWSPFDPYGAGAWCASTNAILTNCVLTGNSAYGPGGGASGGTLYNCTLYGNSAFTGGAATESYLVNCSLLTNSAAEGGGAYGGTLYQCIVNGNTATQEGGGAAQSLLYNCILTGNVADEGGGAWQGTLNNCSLSGNSAATGGGASQATFNNCTVAGNSATGVGGGVYYGTLNNCIVYYNTAPVGLNYYGGSNFAYCCTVPWPPGPGNITAEPLLASSSHLSAQSPCIGMGSANFASGVDIDGQAWLNPPCIGDDQFIPGKTIGPLTVGISVGHTNVSVDFTLPFQAVITGPLAGSVWDFGDGVVVSNHPYASHAWSTAGQFLVKLTAYSDSYPGGVSSTVLVQVGAQQVYYVNAANASPTAPYTNWTAAASNIQDAIDAGSQMGRLVLVADGVYNSGGRTVYGSIINRVVLTEGVQVQSVNGPQKALISGAMSPSGGNGDGAVRCVYVGPNALLNGFSLVNGHTLSDSSSTLEGNGGGAWSEASGVITNCVLNANSAADYAGAAYGGTLYGCILSSNTAIWGGAVSGAFLNNCTLTANSANQGGAAMAATLNNCIMAGNAAVQGGAVENAILNNCILTKNAASYGGGVYESSLNNCTLTANSAGQGGGAYASQGSCVLNNCTLTGNSATDGGGTYSCVLNNCIVYYNAAPNGPNYFAGSTFVYSCTTPQPGGLGNIESEPRLASATHLSAQSPCIGRGNASYASGVDIDGEAWLNPPCMGADQFVPGQTFGPLTVGITAGYTNVGVGFAVPFQALIDGRLSASVWDFGDSIVVSNHPYASHAWAAPGNYVVQLTGYSDSYPGGVSAMVQVQVGASQVYYVDRANLTPTSPFTSWAGAATNIQDAIDAGTQVGRLVLVANGVYDGGGRSVDGVSTNRVVVPEGVELRSVNGPALTVITGAAPQTSDDGGVRCVYVGTNAVLSGFTLTNGHALVNSSVGWDGGGVWCEASGLVTNCILIGNSAADNGGGAYGGTLNGCVLSSNSASAYGGAAAGGTLNHCALTNNSASSGGGAYDATLNYCSLISNAGYSYGGGGAFQAALNNCLLTGNSSGGGGGAFGGILTGCTLSGNWANFGGGALNATLNNCIVYYNGNLFDPNYSGCAMSFCCTTPLPTDGVGNISSDPRFVSGNFHLMPTSPCINAGNNAFVSGTTDLDGNPRIVNGTVDIGAYEYQGAGSAISYAWLQQYGLPTDGSADYADPDHDGMNNWQEWVCGTIPTNALSCLRLVSARPGSTNVAVTWQSVAGITYFLERSANISSPYSPTNLVLTATNSYVGPTNIMLLATNIVGQAGMTTYVDTNTSGPGPFFYRVGVTAP